MAKWLPSIIASQGVLNKRWCELGGQLLSVRRHVPSGWSSEAGHCSTSLLSRSAGRPRRAPRWASPRCGTGRSPAFARPREAPSATLTSGAAGRRRRRGSSRRLPGTRRSPRTPPRRAGRRWPGGARRASPASTRMHPFPPRGTPPGPQSSLERQQGRESERQRPPESQRDSVRRSETWLAAPHDRRGQTHRAGRLHAAGPAPFAVRAMIRALGLPAAAALASKSRTARVASQPPMRGICEGAHGSRPSHAPALSGAAATYHGSCDSSCAPPGVRGDAPACP